MTKAAELAKIVDASGNVVTSGTVEPAGDTAAGDNAAIGFTSAEGIVITGQGSTNDVTIKNDADADVIEIPTGTTNVTVAGTLTATGFIIGSADINENDLESIDGITAGTVAASKAAIVDTNKDITGFRNITLTGELDAATLDVSGDADIDGTLEADAITIGGTAIASVLSPVAGSSSIVTTGALNSGSITSGFGTIDTGSSNITSTGVGTFGSLDISGDIDVDGTTNLDVVDIDGAVDMASTLQVDGAITSSAGATITTADNLAQLTLKSTDADAGSGPVLDLIRDSGSPADGDAVGQIKFTADNDAGEVTLFADIITTVNDASNGTEDGSVFFRSLTAGSNSTIEMVGGGFKFADNAVISMGAGSDLQIFHDGTNSNIKDAATGSLNLIASTKVQVQGVNGETMAIFNEDGGVELRHNDVKAFETVSGGAKVTGDLEVTDDIDLNSDGAKITFGGSSETIIIEHVADTGLNLQGSGTNTNFSLLSFHTSNSTVADLRLGKSSNNTVGTFEVTASGEALGQIRFTGQDSNNGTREGAMISVDQSASSTATTVPSDMKFFTTGTEQVRIHSNGVLSASDGIALGVGTANTASNVLDDYEEGTFTPRVFDSADNVMNLSIAAGFYTKIGRSVHINFYIVLASSGSTFAGNQIYIDGLPFTNANVSNNVNMHQMVRSNVDSTSGYHEVIAYIDQNRNYYQLLHGGDNVAFDNFRGTALSNSCQLILTAHYFVT